MDDLRQLPVLEPGECARVRDEVHALRQEWTQRNLYVPFFTLGAASYLDAAPQRSARYVKRLAHTNPILRARFGWLYARAAAALTELTGEPTQCPEGPAAPALPGFHIYLADSIFTHPVASIHIDLQHQGVPWEAPDEMDFTERLSFTLAIALPRGGAGLRVWAVPPEELRARPWSEIHAGLEQRPVRFHPYTLGSMAVHSGDSVHQAVLMPEAHPDDERITLQGHLARRRGVWQMYW